VSGGNLAGSMCAGARGYRGDVAGETSIDEFSQWTRFSGLAPRGESICKVFWVIPAFIRPIGRENGTKKIPRGGGGVKRAHVTLDMTAAN
jgi:hypothetical protein